MLDLDHFKQFNDRFGHVLGDEALTSRGQSDWYLACDQTAIFARYGGEEMIVILPNTGKDSALLVAERLCERIRSTKVFKNDAIPLPHITASLGLAALQDGQDGLSVIASADAALYRAKERGRNRWQCDSVTGTQNPSDTKKPPTSDWRFLL